MKVARESFKIIHNNSNSISAYEEKSDNRRIHVIILKSDDERRKVQ